MNHERSISIFNESRKYIPGGVNSPVRAFGAACDHPIVADHGRGSRLFDADGNEFIDYICSWGPLIFGHCPDFLVAAVKDAVEKGSTFGLHTQAELEMARLLTGLYPALDMVRMVNSGTEATMSAIRAARGYTGRSLLLKFSGCYHGHSDALLVSAGSGGLTFGVPDSPGVPSQTVADTYIAPYNDIETLETLWQQHGSEFACVIVEPVAGNMGLVPALPAFLTRLRELTRSTGTVLIFDEVISGFRMGLSGAAGIYGIVPDMACFGKIIGGGLPVGAYGGKREIMSVISPEGSVYQAGTLSGNPLAMAAGLACLKMLSDHQELFSVLEQRTAALAEGFKANLSALKLPYQVAQVGSLMCLFFTEKPVRCCDDVKTCDLSLFRRYYNAMLARGILLPPSQFECMFLSFAHTEEDIDCTIKAQLEALKELI